MNNYLTASYDAGQPECYFDNRSNICDNSPINERSAFLKLSSANKFRRWFIGAVVCLCVMLDLTSGGIGSAIALEDGNLLQGAVVEPPHVGVGILTAATLISASLPAGEDPLRKIAIPSPAEILDPRAAILVGMANQPAIEIELEDESSPSSSYLNFGDHRVPRWIVDAITRGAQASGADPVYMMALADKESSFIPDNRAATSSAAGLFQFISSTWLEVIRSFGAKHGYGAEAAAIESIDGQLTVPDARMREHIFGLRRNAYVSTLMAGELKVRDTATIEEKLGRKISRSEFYLSHFLGVDRARKFMSLVDAKPKGSASRLFPAAARANRALFFKKAGRKMRQLTVAEVYEKIDAMIDTRLDRYEGVLGLRVADAAL
jgi:hypothetical protein